MRNNGDIVSRVIPTDINATVTPRPTSDFKNVFIIVASSIHVLLQILYPTNISEVLLFLYTFIKTLLSSFNNYISENFILKRRTP